MTVAGSATSARLNREAGLLPARRDGSAAAAGFFSSYENMQLSQCRGGSLSAGVAGPTGVIFVSGGGGFAASRRRGGCPASAAAIINSLFWQPFFQRASSATFSPALAEASAARRG